MLDDEVEDERIDDEIDVIDEEIEVLIEIELMLQHIEVDEVELVVIGLAILVSVENDVNEYSY